MVLQSLKQLETMGGKIFSKSQVAKLTTLFYYKKLYPTTFETHVDSECRRMMGLGVFSEINLNYAILCILLWRTALNQIWTKKEKREDLH